MRRLATAIILSVAVAAAVEITFIKGLADSVGGTAPVPGTEPHRVKATFDPREAWAEYGE